MAYAAMLFIEYILEMDARTQMLVIIAIAMGYVGWQMIKLMWPSDSHQ